MAIDLRIYATYSVAQISAARKDFYARAVRAAGILAAVNSIPPTRYQYGVVSAYRFWPMLESCVRHAAKAHGMRARDLWAVLPEDVCDRVEDLARVSAVC